MPADDKPARNSETRAHPRTRMIHGQSRSRRWDYSHHVVPPITSSATFRLESAARGAQGFCDFAHDSADTHDPIYIYDRLEEPTRSMLEDNLAAAEKGESALCFASGMGAISAALMTLCETGDHIVSHRVLYGCTYSLMTNWLPRNQIKVAFEDLTNIDALRNAITPRTRVVYFETPVNPDMTLIDIAAVAAVVADANKPREPMHRIRIIVDNTFATPHCQRPIEFGADVVCHSLTKGIGGFGTDIGGAVITSHDLRNRLLMYRKDFGGILSPKSAWATLVYGLPSLAARMANYQKTAHRVADHLVRHPKIERVLYPGLETFPQFALAKKQMRDTKGHFTPGSMLYFVLKDRAGDGKVGERFVDWIAQNSYAISLAVSLGQIKTLVECPFIMTHSAIPPDEMRRRGILPGGIRLSCGLEDWEDIVADLEDALDVV
ncbi:MAG: aminotransferase class I/II-fold pyridoxal phosphate-dependent enzyme [Planctomycetes bacterium]|nr:aminotransferase class I/II-fold pyridoxal phosphate-dependent enzyme [Planctomycetota bacterium]